MMNIKKTQIHNHMTLEYGWTGIRIPEDNLVPVNWFMTVDFVAAGQKSKSREELEKIAQLAYQRMYFWLDINLSNIIIVNTDNDLGMDIANAAGNIMMYCPNDCSDEMIIQCLHAKLSALAGKDLIIGQMTLKSDDTSAKYTFNSLDGQYELPDLVSQYILGETMHKTPWWTRRDGFCFEFGKPEEFKDITPEVFFEDIRDPLVEFEKSIAQSFEAAIEEIQNAEKKPAEIIQIEKWKPTIIK